MTKELLIPDFDGVLQEYYENGFNVTISYEPIPDGGFALEINGVGETECLADLQSLAEFQSKLQTMKKSGALDRLVGHFRRQIIGTTTRDN